MKSLKIYLTFWKIVLTKFKKNLSFKNLVVFRLFPKSNQLLRIQIMKRRKNKGQ